MMIPSGLDVAAATFDELVAAYLERGLDREDAEALAELLKNPPDAILI